MNHYNLLPSVTIHIFKCRITTGVNHVKSMWRSCERRENFTCFFTWACVKNSVKSPCENQVKWDGPFHIMDDVKKLCEIGNSHHALYRLGLMIWCEKLCETCEKTMWNKKIHIMHCKTRLNDMMWKTMWNLFWLTCKREISVSHSFSLYLDHLRSGIRTWPDISYIYICMQIMRMPMIYMQPIASCSWPDHDRSCD